MLHLGVLQFTIEIPYAESLKDKRSVVKALKDRLRRSFNISIAETDDLDDCRTATLGAVIAGNDVAHVNSTLDHLLNKLQDWREATLQEHQIEIFTPR
ncbi:MAG: DUF503 domain-containing protein [Planctomycetota bacterium]